MKKIIIFLILLLSAQAVSASAMDYRDIKSYPAGSEDRVLTF